MQELLKEAAKAQLRRFCKPHKKRQHLDAPSWVVEEWKKRPQGETAQLLINCNFDKAISVSARDSSAPQEKFTAELEIIVINKKTIKVTVTEEWCSEKEMKDDHGWTAYLESNVSCVKCKLEAKDQRCGESLQGKGRDSCEVGYICHRCERLNQYDGVEEFYVVLKERGERTQEQSKSEMKRAVTALDQAIKSFRVTLFRQASAPKLGEHEFSDLRAIQDRAAADEKDAEQNKAGSQAPEAGSCLVS